MATLTLPAGTRIGDYEILDLLGRGGFGAVYRARDAAGGWVALKLIRPEAGVDAEQAERIRRRVEREIKALSRVRSTAIVQLYRWGMHDGLFWLAMEYVEGVTLTTVLQAGPLAPGRAVRLALHLLEGLAVAHDAGIVHRDLKPDNIMVQPRRLGGEDAKILDFGVARMRRKSADTFETADGDKVFGTPAYMAPEQGRGQVSPATDLYAVGTILHEMLLGLRPFGAETALETMVAKLRDPLPPYLRQSGLPAGLIAACEAALERDPADRPPNAAALYALLAPFAGLDGPPTRFTGPLYPVSDQTTSQIRGEIALPPEAPASRRPLLIAALVGLVGTGITLALLLGGDPSSGQGGAARPVHLPRAVEAPPTAAPESVVATPVAAPVIAAPVTAAPESAAPESAAPESAAPESAAPESVAPESAAPPTAAPASRTRPSRPIRRPPPRRRSSITDF